ncbi:MAG: FxsA family protein [Rhizobiaceae bacterium]
MRFSLIPFLLLVIPILEITIFILVGGEIGIVATLALIFLTAVIGSILLRVQGFATLRKIQSDMEQNRLPGRELGNGAMILVAGVLLLTPGFVTDAIGFALFVPALRNALWQFLVRHINIVTVSGRETSHPAGGHPEEEIIDLDPDEYYGEPNQETPWRKINGKD